MENLKIFYQILASILGAVITMGGAWAVISKCIAPFKRVTNEIEGLKADNKELHDKCKELEQHNKQTSSAFKEGNDCICKCLLALMDHELDGNNVEMLKKAKEDMRSYLIERK